MNGQVLDGFYWSGLGAEHLDLVDGKAKCAWILRQPCEGRVENGQGSRIAVLELKGEIEYVIEEITSFHQHFIVHRLQ